MFINKLSPCCPFLLSFTRIIYSSRFDGLEDPKNCSNSSVDQGIFECIFNLTFPKERRTYPAISILIRGDSEEVRPVCASKNPTTLGEFNITSEKYN